MSIQNNNAKQSESIMQGKSHSQYERIKQHKKFILWVCLVAITILLSMGVLASNIDWSKIPFIVGYPKKTTKITESIKGKTTEITTEAPQGKTLWDWLQLLIVPIILAIGGFWLNQIQKSREQKTTEKQEQLKRELAYDDQHEAALQEYIDKMSELLLKENLRGNIPTFSEGGELKSGDEVRTVARARTLTVLSRLDGYSHSKWWIKVLPEL